MSAAKSEAIYGPPLVSVVVPAYCAAPYIEQTLRSVLAQTYRNIEVLVVDDGSIDNTFEIANQVAKEDCRIRLFQQPNKGAAAARNYAIEQSAGQFIAPIDADDIWLPTYLEKLVRFLETSDRSVAIVYAWSVFSDESGTPVGNQHAYNIEGDVYNTLLCHYFPGNASCAVIRRSCLDDVGLYITEFRERGSEGCEDWNLYLRIANKYKFGVVPEFLVHYRKTAASMSRNSESMARSHSLVLDQAERANRLPSFIRGLSTSSFYIYLACQNAESGRRAETLNWIKRACQVHWITTVIRPEMYLLLFSTLGCNDNAGATLSKRNRCKPLQKPGFSILRLFAGSILQLSLRALFGRHSFESDRTEELETPGTAYSVR